MELNSKHLISCLSFYINKFIPVSSNSKSSLKFEKKGYREYLLCGSCETKLSRWENKLKSTLDELITENHSCLHIESIGDIKKISNIDYNYVKKAVLSIFWRLSISSLEIFASYDFGPYNEKLRFELNKDLSFPDSNFPIVLSKAIIAGQFRDGILMMIGRGRYGNNFIMQSVILNGFLFDLVMSEGRAIPKEILSFCIKDSGPAFMTTREFSDYGLPLDSFQERVTDQDITNFFNRHG